MNSLKKRNFITAVRKRSERATEQLFRALFEQSGNICMVLDPNTLDGIPVIIVANKAACEAHGYTQEEFVGKKIAVVDDEEGKELVRRRTQQILSEGSLSVENIHVRKDGTKFPVAVSAFRVDTEGELPVIFTTEQDISERKQSEAKILRLATTDQLTGLANRSFFSKHMQQSIKLADREDSLLALMYIDLDRFKSVNDTYGHPVGESQLSPTKSVASTLTKSSRDADIVARLGGDEFAILVVHPKDEVAVRQIAQRIIDEIRNLRRIEGHEIEISVSIGISLYPRDANSEGELMKKSDLALYEVKNRGRGNFLFYRSDMTAEQ